MEFTVHGLGFAFLLRHVASPFLPATAQVADILLCRPALTPGHRSVLTCLTVGYEGIAGHLRTKTDLGL